jgi:hypothetical protein
VQSWLSSQLGGVPGVQMPAWQISVPLQRSPSPHPGVGPFGTGTLLQVPALHASVVHGFPSLHSAAVVHGLTTHDPVGGSHTFPAGQTTNVP